MPFLCLHTNVKACLLRDPDIWYICVYYNSFHDILIVLFLVSAAQTVNVFDIVVNLFHVKFQCLVLDKYMILSNEYIYPFTYSLNVKVLLIFVS